MISISGFYYCFFFFFNLCRRRWDVFPQCEEGPWPVPPDLLRLCEDLASHDEECREGPPSDYQLSQ